MIRNPSRNISYISQAPSVYNWDLIDFTIFIWFVEWNEFYFQYFPDLLRYNYKNIFPWKSLPASPTPPSQLIWTNCSVAAAPPAPTLRRIYDVLIYK